MLAVLSIDLLYVSLSFSFLLYWFISYFLFFNWVFPWFLLLSVFGLRIKNNWTFHCGHRIILFAKHNVFYALILMDQHYYVPEEGWQMHSWKKKLVVSQLALACTLAITSQANASTDISGKTYTTFEHLNDATYADGV